MDQPPRGSEGEAETPLHAAAWNGDLRRIRRLVRAGADVNVRDDTGETPLHGAAAWGHSSVVRLLLSLGARHDLPGTGQNQPLHWAAGWGSLGCVRALVRAGADVQSQDTFGNTPLVLAQKHGKLRTVQWLLAMGKLSTPLVTALVLGMSLYACASASEPNFLPPTPTVVVGTVVELKPEAASSLAH